MLLKNMAELTDRRRDTGRRSGCDGYHSGQHLEACCEAVGFEPEGGLGLIGSGRRGSQMRRRMSRPSADLKAESWTERWDWWPGVQTYVMSSEDVLPFLIPGVPPLGCIWGPSGRSHHVLCPSAYWAHAGVAAACQKWGLDALEVASCSTYNSVAVDGGTGKMPAAPSYETRQFDDP